MGPDIQPLPDTEPSAGALASKTMGTPCMDGWRVLTVQHGNNDSLVRHYEAHKGAHTEAESLNNAATAPSGANYASGAMNHKNLAAIAAYISAFIFCLRGSPNVPASCFCEYMGAAFSLA